MEFSSQRRLSHTLLPPQDEDPSVDKAVIKQMMNAMLKARIKVDEYISTKYDVEFVEGGIRS